MVPEDIIKHWPSFLGGPENVSRETIDGFSKYFSLLSKWSRAYNLVGRAENEWWVRHFCDSLQLCLYIKSDDKKWLDMGSGAGFPGMVLSLMGIHTTLVESNQKKATFLEEVAGCIDKNPVIKRIRIEEIPTEDRYDGIIARALAPLNQLLQWSEPHVKTEGRLLFLKGAQYKSELTEAEKYWSMKLNVHKSKIDPDGVVLEISQLQQKQK